MFREGGLGIGQDPSQKGGGAPPELPRMPFVRGLNQEMGGNPQDLLRTPDFLGFHPECAHLLLQGVYGDFP